MAKEESSRICIKNLPKYVDDRKLYNFISKNLNVKSDESYDISDCKVLQRNGKSRRVAFVGFKTSKQAQDAVKVLHKSFLDTSKLIIEVALPIGHKVLAKKRNQLNRPQKGSEKNNNDIGVRKENIDTLEKAKMSFFNSDEENTGVDEDYKRLFIRNLNYNTNEAELQSYFSNFGDVESVQIIRDTTGKSKGFGFIEYSESEFAVIAQAKADGHSLQGRLIHVIPAYNKVEIKQVKSDDTSDKLSSYQTKKIIGDKNNARNETNWNSLFLRPDAVLSAFSKSRSIKLSKLELIASPEKIKAELKNSNLTDSGAVNLALMEAELIAETKQFLEDNGVNLESLEKGILNPFDVPRSKDTILVKNLPNETDPLELRQKFFEFGELERFVMPNSKTIALVRFYEAKHAKQAFDQLAYSKYKSLPLFLEMAPSQSFHDSVAVSLKDVESSNISNGTENDNEVNNHIQSSLTLFVKNLNFDTSEDDLISHVGKITGNKEAVRKVTITKHKKQGQALSKGFGFIEFKDTASCRVGFRKLNKTVLQNHELMVSISQSSSSVRAEKSNKEKIKKLKRKSTSAQEKSEESNKILVKNLAFEATKIEIHKLFSAIGEVQSIRLPKSFSRKSRGFCFVTFSVKSEAKKAMNVLQSTHLYGRKLVLEWAKLSEDEILINKKQKLQT